MSPVQAILFDKDGTLLDFNATWGEFAREFAKEAAGDDPQETERLLTLIGYNHQSGRFEPGSVFAAGTNAELMATLFPCLSGEKLQRMISWSNRRAAEIALTRSVPLPGILEAIRQLGNAGFRMGIATNDSEAGAKNMLQCFGIAQLFDAAFGYDSVARPKPAPDVIHAFCEVIGLPASAIAMVGDNLHDLIPAREAGAGLAIGVLSGTSRRVDLETVAHIVIDSVADLPLALKPLAAEPSG